MLWCRRTALIVSVTLLYGATASAQPPARNGKPGGRVDALGDPLPAGALFRLGTTRLQLDRELQAVAVSADGKRLAAISDAMLGVWELPGGKEILRQSLDFAERAAVAPVLVLAPDGQTLITNAMQAVRWLDARTGKERANLGEEAGAAVFAADGKTLTLLQLESSVVRRYDTTTGKRLNEWLFNPESTLRGATASNYAVQFRLSGDGRLLATLESNRAGRKQLVRIFEAASGNEVRRWSIATPAVRQLEFSADGSFLAGAGREPGGRAEASARVWEVATGKELAQWQLKDGLSSGRPALAFTPDGNSVLATETAGVVRWDWRQGKRLHEYPDVGGPLAFTDDGRTLVAQGPLGAVRLLDIATGKDVCPLPHVGKQVAIAPDSQSVAWSDGGAIVLGAATGRELRRWPAHERFVGPLAFAPDGKSLASAGTDLRIGLWQLPDGHVQKTLIRTGVNHLHFASDGRHLISSGTGDLCLWDRVTGKRLGWWYGRGDAPIMAPDLSAVAVPDRPARRLVLRDPLTAKDLRTLIGYRAVLVYALEQPLVGMETPATSFAPRFSPDGRLLLMGADPTKDGELSMIQVWNLATGRRTAALRGQEIMLDDVAFSPDSRLLAAMRSDRRLCLLHATSAAQARLLDRCEGALSAPPVFTADGRTLITAVSSALPHRHLVQVWEVATGGELARWTGHQDAVREFAVSADGRLLVTMSADHTALAWDLAHLAGTDRPAASELWSELASLDAKRGRRAVEALLAKPDQAVKVLGKQLQPAPVPNAQELARWIKELDSDDFAQRSQAEQALDRSAETAGPTLHKALAGKLPLEARRRIEGLLKKLHGPTLTAAQVRAIRAVQVLEELRVPEARRLLEACARGAPEARLTVEAAAALSRHQSRDR